jgi:U3 small nucleolar RNA-associated protein 7
VGEFKTKIKQAKALSQIPTNSVLVIGDNKGEVTMWSPNTGVPLVKMLCHKGMVNSVACHPNGQHKTLLVL